ncbi:MAG: restriction endonuclease subunit S [Deltaproteobacteria bacterium]|nr:restriction endonuclease subunit S [Deltaproteobacteria bacterium]
MKFDAKAVEEVTRTLIDYRGKTPPKCERGIRLITAKVIKEGFIQNDKEEYISEETYEWWMRRGYPKQWDILITTEAPLGQVAQIRGEEQIALAQRVILLRGNPKFIDQQYYFQALKSPFVQAGLRQRSTGTTVLGIKQSELRQVQIPHPPLPTQRKIASILSAYDDLIENNLRRIKVLEEMAQALYREWFVKFRFPGHEKVRMVDSPLSKIPEGWEVSPLSDVCHLVMGQSPKSEFYNKEGNGLPFHQGVSDFGDRFPSDRLYCTIENRIAERGDILFSVRAPVGRINLANKRIVIGRGLSAIRHHSNYQWFTFHFLKEKFKKEDTMGGGTIFKAVTTKDMQEIEFIVPDYAIVTRFENLVSPAELEIENLTNRNELLRQTRDLLLPKLISGALDVSDLDINTSALEEQAPTDIDSTPNGENQTNTIPQTEVKEAPVKHRPLSREEKSSVLHEDPSPLPIDQWETNAVLSVFRSIARGRGIMDRENFFREAARKMGYKQLGTRINSALRGHVPSRPTTAGPGIQHGYT